MEHALELSKNRSNLIWLNSRIFLVEINLRGERRISNISIILYIFSSKIILSSDSSFSLILFSLKLLSKLEQNLSLESSILLNFNII